MFQKKSRTFSKKIIFFLNHFFFDRKIDFFRLIFFEKKSKFSPISISNYFCWVSKKKVGVQLRCRKVRSFDCRCFPSDPSTPYPHILAIYDIYGFRPKSNSYSRFQNNSLHISLSDLRLALKINYFLKI